MVAQGRGVTIMRRSMHPAPFLELVCTLLRSVLRFEQPADRLLSSFFRNHRELGARERHAVAETVYEILRRRLLLQPAGPTAHPVR